MINNGAQPEYKRVSQQENEEVQTQQSTNGYSSNLSDACAGISIKSREESFNSSEKTLGKRKFLLKIKNPFYTSSESGSVEIQKNECSHSHEEKTKSPKRFMSKANKKAISKLNRAQDLIEVDEMINQMGKTETPLISKAPNKKFEGIPPEWHQVYKYFNPQTKKYKLYFKCMHEDCGMLFNKSCNIRDHFRKHNGSRPFVCHLCLNTFTQQGNLKKHLIIMHQKEPGELIEKTEANKNTIPEKLR